MKYVVTIRLGYRGMAYDPLTAIRARGAPEAGSSLPIRTQRRAVYPPCWLSARTGFPPAARRIHRTSFGEEREADRGFADTMALD